MKLSVMLIFMVILQATIMFYTGIAPSDDLELAAYKDNDTAIWSFVTNPVGWKTTNLQILLVGIGVLGVGFIIAGTFFNTPSDTALFAPIFAMLLAAGVVPILSLYTVITSNYAMFGCDLDAVCAPALWLWIFTGGIIGLLYVLSVLEWWSGRSMG